MAVVFRLTSWVDGHSWTALASPRGQRLFGRVAMTYAAEQDGVGSRIVCRVAVALGPGPGRRTRSRGATW